MGSVVLRMSIENMLASQLEPWALKYLAPALNGNEEAAFSLCVAAGDASRGILAVSFWQYKAPVPVYRVLLSSAWDHNHREVIAGAGNLRTLRAMFRYAAFPLPSDMPEVVRVWRGTSYLSEKESAKGYSWTISKDVACWFAMRFADKNTNPLVLAADVLKSEILLYNDERSEQEAVILKTPAYWIDGCPEEWREGYERYSATMCRVK